MKRNFKLIEGAFAPGPPAVPANVITIQVVDNGYIVQIIDVEDQQTLEVYKEQDVVEMLQAIATPLGFQLTPERGNQ